MKVVNGERCDDSKKAYTIKIGLPLLGLAIVVAFTGAFFSSSKEAFSTTSEIIDVLCDLSGNIHVVTQLDNRFQNPRWDPSLFLDITLGFGSFSFATAKGIDICWDLVVGRAGQLLLAILAYPVIRRSLAASMESNAIGYKMYASIAFDKISLRSLRAVAQDLVGRQRLSATRETRWSLSMNANLLGIALVVTYILAFPSMVSIMTGYQTPFTALVKHPNDGFLMEASSLSIPLFVIRDGSRVGLRNDMPIFLGDGLTTMLLAYAGTASYQKGLGDVGCSQESVWQQCYQALDFSSTLPFGFLEKECWFQVECGPPKLQPGHTASDDFYDFLSHYTRSNITVEETTWNLSAPPLNIIVQHADVDIPPPTINYLSDGNITMSSDYLKKNSVCQPAGYYQWGFSSLLLFVFCLLTIVFGIVLYILHWRAFWYSQNDRYHYDVNHYRDAVDLVHEFETEYSGAVIRRMPAKTLANEVSRSGKGIRLDTDGLSTSRSDERKRRRGGQTDLGAVETTVSPQDQLKTRGITFHALEKGSNHSADRIVA